MYSRSVSVFSADLQLARTFCILCNSCCIHEVFLCSTAVLQAFLKLDKFSCSNSISSCLSVCRITANVWYYQILGSIVSYSQPVFSVLLRVISQVPTTIFSLWFGVLFICSSGQTCTVCFWCTNICDSFVSCCCSLSKCLPTSFVHPDSVCDSY